MKTVLAHRSHTWVGLYHRISLVGTSKGAVSTEIRRFFDDEPYRSFRRDYDSWDEAVAGLPAALAHIGVPVDALVKAPFRSYLYEIDDCIQQYIDEGEDDEGRSHWQISYVKDNTIPLDGDGFTFDQLRQGVHCELGGYEPNWEAAIAKSLRVLPILLDTAKRAQDV